MTETPTASLTVTFTRGSLLWRHEGYRAFAVETDGPIRGRGLLWVDAGDESEYRVIPADAWGDLTGTSR